MSLADEIMMKAKQNPDWDAGKLADHFGCRREYVRISAKRLGFRFKIYRLKTWNEADDAKLRNLRDNEKMKWNDIALAMDRPRSSCQGRYSDLTEPPPKTNLIADRITVPAERFAERNVRVNLAPRDLTAAFFGDPKPGFSALERRS